MIFRLKEWSMITDDGEVWDYCYANNTTPKLTASNTRNIHSTYGVYIEGNKLKDFYNDKITVLI
jgi:hypothetical protein